MFPIEMNRMCNRLIVYVTDYVQVGVDKLYFNWVQVFMLNWNGFSWHTIEMYCKNIQSNTQH